MIKLGYKVGFLRSGRQNKRFGLSSGFKVGSICTEIDIDPALTDDLAEHSDILLVRPSNLLASLAAFSTPTITSTQEIDIGDTLLSPAQKQIILEMMV